MIEPNIETRQFIEDFIKRVLPPGEQKGTFDERITFEEAVEFAQRTESDYGEPLLDALESMRLATKQVV